MHVVICIVGYRNAADIVACLAALEATTHHDFAVVVCENGGAAACADLRAQVPETLAGGQPVALIAADNPGYAGGVNLCMRARAGADAWWVLNPDTVPAPDALERLVERLARGDCAAAGGVLHYEDGRVQMLGGRWRPWLSRPVSIARGASVDGPFDAARVERDMNFIAGASMLIGRRLVDAVGLMREDYFLYCEEVEWCLRAQAHGLKLGFAARARVLHHQGTTTGSADSPNSRPRLPIYLDERNKLNVVRDTTPARLAVAAPAALVLLTLRFARRGAWRQWRWALAGWWAGVRNRRGRPAFPI